MGETEGGGRRGPLPPEPPSASSDSGIGPSSFLDHPIWEPTIKGLSFLTMIGTAVFILFAFVPMLMMATDEAWWLTAVSTIFMPTGLLAVFLLSFGIGKILERLSLFGGAG